MANPTERFSNRVENYIRYRPHYPPAIIDFLHSSCGLQAASIIADIGSGTGILSEMFLRNGNTVYAVEPNREMREAGERLLGHYTNFRSVPGSAEASTLEPISIDIITAGQAFHWFDEDKAKAEFLRILKPSGWVVLIWNDRRENSSAFAVAYEQLLQTYATDYREVNHKRINHSLLSRFFSNGYLVRNFENSQHFNFEALKGRLLSSSYAPEAGQPGHEPMLTELSIIFDSYQDNGEVVFEYDTCIYYGQLLS